MGSRIEKVEAYKVGSMLFESEREAIEEAQRAFAYGLVRVVDNDFREDSSTVLINILSQLRDNGITSKKKLQALIDTVDML